MSALRAKHWWPGDPEEVGTGFVNKTGRKSSGTFIPEGPREKGSFNFVLLASMGCGASSNASSVVENAILIDETEPCVGNLTSDYLIGEKLGQ